MQDYDFRDLIHMVYTHFRGMWRHRWHMMAMAWFVCLTGWGAVAFMEDQYMAQGRILIENPQAPIKDHMGKDLLMMPDPTTEARRVLSSLLNRENLMRAIQESDLTLRVRNPKEIEETLALLRAQLTLAPEQATIYKIVHRSPHPRVTKQVIESLLNTLMEKTFSGGVARSLREVQKLLVQQINTAEAKVTVLEQELREFKNKNRFPSGGIDEYYEQLQKVQNELKEENYNLIALEKKKENLQQQLEKRFAESSTIGAIEKKIAALHQQKLALLDRFYEKGGIKHPLYTEGHADVVAITRQIEAQNRKKQQEIERLEKMRNAANDTSSASDSVIANLKEELIKNDTALSEVRGRVEQFETKLSELRKLEGEIPAVEVELIRLQSRFQMHKERLLKLLKKQIDIRHQIEVTEESGKGVRFKILESPRIPLKPYGPNRPLFVTIVLIGGTLSGLALGLFFSVIRPVFDTPSLLKKELGLPVLGTVSRIDDSPTSALLGTKFIYIFALLALLGAYGSILILAKAL
ncbi:hypothetical protein ACQZV8_15950 [Magnetococcales bacterium HHB-1]